MVQRAHVIDEETAACPSCKGQVLVPDYARKGTPLRCLGCHTSFFYEPDKEDHGLRADLRPAPHFSRSKPAASWGNGASRRMASQGRQEATDGPPTPAAPVTTATVLEAHVAKVGDTLPVVVEPPAESTSPATVYGKPWKRYLPEMKADVASLGLVPAAEKWEGRGMARHIFSRLTKQKLAWVGVKKPREPKAPRPPRVPGIKQEKEPPKVHHRESDAFGHLYALLRMEVEDMEGKPDLKRSRIIKIMAYALVEMAHALVEIVAIDQDGQT